MAVKKKAPAKKKAAAKKVVKKVAKKAPAKKVAKKAAAKKVAKKAPAKKKAAAKKVVKKAAKKAPARKKRAVKKSAAKKSSSANSLVIPPVPVGGVKRPSAVNVSTTPVAKPAPAAKPSAAPKQQTSPRVLIAAIIGIALLAIVVISRPASDGDDVAPVPSATASESAAPEMSEEATPEASEPATNGEAVAAVEAPGRFIGNWKDSSKSVMVITWRAPAATAGLTGYKFEVRSGMGEWKESGVLPADQLSIEFTKTSTDSSTSFRVSSVYSDGQIATAKAFGFAGQFE